MWMRILTKWRSYLQSALAHIKQFTGEAKSLGQFQEIRLEVRMCGETESVRAYAHSTISWRIYICDVHDLYGNNGFFFFFPLFFSTVHAKAY